MVYYKGVIMQGKVWGCTEAIIKTHFFEAHRIITEEGGFCSKHRHDHKHNLFYVESGCLEVIVYNDNGTEDRTIINAGCQCAVPPGVWHRFSAIEDSIAYELYWIDTLDQNDIKREDVGGVR